MRGVTHAPVMLPEVLEGLAVRGAGRYVDATYGRGGHARAVLERLGPDGVLVVVDRDPQAVASARREFGQDARVQVHHSTFDRLAALLGDARADGVLFDLGVSSPQLDDAARGFSFLRDGPLDMRMDPGSGESAAAYLARVGEAELAGVIRRYGEERFAGRIARAIVRARDAAPLATPGELARLIAATVPARSHEPGKHPATRSFQALRIHLNGELEQLERGLDAALAVLRAGGRLVALSFHSLEDRLVKRFMRRHANGDPLWRGLPQVPAAARPKLSLCGGAQQPGATETAANPRARSAVLRVAERLPA